MRIEKLSLSSFRSFQGMELSTSAPRVLVAGVNGTGKTSIREVIKWVLTGRCQGLDGKGMGADVLMPFGTTDGAVASVHLAGIGRVTRMVKNGTGSFAVEGFTGTSQIQQNALYAKLETSPAFLDAVLDTETFLRLHHADAKALVLNLLNVRIALGDEPNSPVYSLTELDQLYEAAFEERKAAKRILQQSAIPQKPSDDPQPSMDAVDAQLKKLRGELETASQAIGDTTGQRAVLQREYQKLLMPLSQPSMGRYPSEAALRDRKGDLEERLAILEAEAEPTPTPAPPSGVVDVAFLRRRSEALAAHKPTKGCVLDPTVPCKTPKADFTRAHKAVDAELATMELPPEAHPDAGTIKQSLVKELRVVGELLAQQDQWRVDQSQRGERRKALEADLTALADTSAHEAQIAALKARIAKGEALLRQAQAHATASALYEQATAVREKQRADVERLETLVATLGPNGVRVKALEQAIDRFTSLVNTYTEPFGWRLSFTLDPWRVLANDRPVETYSKSEQFRIAVALQLSIAVLSGLGLAVIDELDMLDHKNRGLVTQMIMSSPLDQVIVIGTREPGTPLPQTPNVLAYRLGQEDGWSTVVERSGSASLAA